ncbi:MAG: hypothetical protein KA004_00420 [Verrucomicrobiales bacterium]|nr:hypothetical protein [Verrucomicrobiales bacterium]
MKDISDKIYEFLYHGLSLQTVGIIVGLMLILSHAWALWRAEATQEWLRKLPRNQSLGTWILTLDFIWALLVATSMDLGEFARLRYLAQVALPLIYLSMLFYTNDYLGARSVGILACLAACPILNAAFLQPPQSRAVLAALCYVWVVFGLFWIGMPYTLRDQATWVTKSPGRWKTLCLAGIGYGVLVLACALLFWNSPGS